MLAGAVRHAIHSCWPIAPVVPRQLACLRNPTSLSTAGWYPDGVQQLKEQLLTGKALHQRNWSLRRVHQQRLVASSLTYRSSLLGNDVHSDPFRSRTSRRFSGEGEMESLEAGSVDCVVVGAGVVGLACARALALAGQEVLILEEQAHFGQGTSSRSSEVIHAGIYYPANSLKARFCVEGKEMLYSFCSQKSVPHKRMGKLLVATKASQNEQLVTFQSSGKKNGVMDLELLSSEEAQAMEPALHCTAALWSPSTGIVDSHAFMEALLDGAVSAGASLAVNTAVTGVDASRSPLKVVVRDRASGEEAVVTSKVVVNAAGLGAHQVAHRTLGLASSHVPPQYFAKGNYFTLSGPAPFTRLIYPMPEPGGIGVHLTLDMMGMARFGPDVEWVDSINYEVEASRGDKFYARVREYYPELPDNILQPAYCGIRPKISAPGEPARDFLIQNQQQHGLKGLVNLFGIESPGITSSLAIGQHVVRSLGLRTSPC